MFGRNFFLIILGTIGIYSIFAFASDLNLVYKQLSLFNYQYIPIILITIFSSWLVLFLRWTILLKTQKINIPLKNSILIYFSGFTLSISPVKSGELIKSVFLKNKFNIKRSLTVPLIFLERFYDILGTSIVAIIGLSYLGINFLPLIFVVFVIIFVALWIFYSKNMFNKIIKFFNKFRFVQKYVVSLENAHNVVRESSNLKIGIISTSLTILYRFIEAIGVYFVLLALGIDVFEFISLAATYSSSVILGSMSMSPGGIGVTEASLGGLLSLQGIEFEIALVVAIIVRFFTLWFSVITGFICLKLSNVLKEDVTSN